MPEVNPTDSLTPFNRDADVDQVLVQARKESMFGGPSSFVWLRKLPWPVIRVCVLGGLLLALIVGCIVLESMRVPDHLSLHNHSVAERKYHMRMVNYVNRNPNATWKNDANFSPALATGMYSLNEAHTARSVDGSTDELFRFLDSFNNSNLPTHFDAREKWYYCWSVHDIPNQGGCGNCWAASAVSVMSDRICIHSKGKLQPQISAEDLTTCCEPCGGCQGSLTGMMAFLHWKETGIVTGGHYQSFEGCKPYSVSSECGQPCTKEVYMRKRSAQCLPICTNRNYATPYDDDKHFAKSAMWLRATLGLPHTVPEVRAMFERIMHRGSGADLTLYKRHPAYGRDESDTDTYYLEGKQALNERQEALHQEVVLVPLLKRELMENGPVLACFTVTEDFQHYHRGIYQRDQTGSSEDLELYGHCVKLLGWGTQNNVDYWLLMNTWGRTWGEAGFFRVISTELPEEIIAGLPDTVRSTEDE